MNKIFQTISAVTVGAFLLSTLPACQKPDGPAEHVGKEIDQTVEKAGQQIEKAGERIQDAATPEKK